MSKINVLDFGYVSLVDNMGNDKSIVSAARVSYNAVDKTGADDLKDKKLIKYLMKNKHTTPFESVVFTFEVKAPIFVFRQMHRHRTQSINEISARYTELPAECYTPDEVQITTQSKNNKQMRTEEQNENACLIHRIIHEKCESSFSAYKALLEYGCPRELARTVLPLSTYSKMFTTMNLHNLFHFIKLRTHQHAQYEIRVYAEAMLELIEPIVPVAVEAYKDIENV